MELKTKIVETQFKLDNTYSYDLSVLIGADRFFYVISDAENNIIKQVNKSFQSTTFSELCEHLSPFLKEETPLQKNYKQIKIAISNSYFSLIPSKLYDPKHKEWYLKGVVEPPRNEIIKKDEVIGFDMSNVYAIHADLFKLIEAHFSEATIYHLGTSLIQAFGEKAKGSQEPRAFVNIQQGVFQILVFQHGILQLYNAYHYQSTEDFVYFVMLVFDQLQLSPDTVKLTISGEIMKDADLYELLYRYIRFVEFIERPTHYLFGEQLEATAIPAHFHFDLYSLNLCE